MEALVIVVTGLGLVGSVALLVWGLVLCLQHGLGIDGAGPERTA